MPTRVLASGTKPCGGNNVDFILRILRILRTGSGRFPADNTMTSHQIKQLKWLLSLIGA